GMVVVHTHRFRRRRRDGGVDDQPGERNELRHEAAIARCFPERYTIAPIPISTSERPTTFTTANVLFGSISEGMHASTIDTAVTMKPIDASAVATGVPPGTRRTSGPAGSRCSTIIAANMNRNGMK